MDLGLPEECAEGCEVLLVFSAPGDARRAAPVPVSPLFDPTLPEAARGDFTLVWFLSPLAALPSLLDRQP